MAVELTTSTAAGLSLVLAGYAARRAQFAPADADLMNAAERLSDDAGVYTEAHVLSVTTQLATRPSTERGRETDGDTAAIALGADLVELIPE